MDLPSLMGLIRRVLPRETIGDMRSSQPAGISSRDSGRRNFFRALFGQAKSMLDEAHGIPQLLLDDLPQLPEEKLRQVIPVIFPHVQLSYRDGYVNATLHGSTRRLFRSNSPDLEIFNRFDGKNSIGTICAALEVGGENGARPELNYARVSRLFLQLVEAEICVPANAIG